MKFEIQKETPKDLQDLIIWTESMDDDERQYWFDVIPSMDKNQIQRLFKILDDEKKKIEELEQKSNKKIAKLNKDHLIEWQQELSKKTKWQFQTKILKNKNK